MSVDGSRDHLIDLQGWPKDGEERCFAASRAWDETWVGDDEHQLLESEEEDSDGSIRALEDDSEDEAEDGREFLDLANFPVPVEPSSEEEGGGEEGNFLAPPPNPANSTSPQRGGKPSFSVALICDTSRRIPASASTN